MTDTFSAMAPAAPISAPHEAHRPGPRAATVAIGICAVGIVAIACSYAGFFGAYRTALSDFNAFVIAGQLAWDGALAEGYHWRFMMAAQKAFTGGDAFMPWAYPPPYNLVAATLAALPQWAGYLLLVGAPFGFLCVMLARVAPAHATVVFVALFPSAMVTIMNGQNGFLTAALLAGACALALRNSAWAGLLLGVMVIKPHLAVGVALFFVMRGCVRVLGLASFTASALCLAATLAFGVKIWPAFLTGVREAQDFLAAGLFQLDKMPTAYASARTMGFSLQTSLQIHAAVAALAAAAAAAGALWIRDVRMALGVACLCSLFISPYLYDYDLALLAVATALLAPAVATHVGAPGMAVMVASSWLAAGSWLWPLLDGRSPAESPGADQMPEALANGLAAVAQGAAQSVGAFGLLLFAGLAAVTVWRHGRRAGA